MSKSIYDMTDKELGALVAKEKKSGFFDSATQVEQLSRSIKGDTCYYCNGPIYVNGWCSIVCRRGCSD